MKATRRRARKLDPLASAEGVNRVLASLHASLPDLIPRSHKSLTSLLNSVRGLYARPSMAAKRGRPARYSREQLLRVDSRLRAVLARETSISVRSFVGQYLPILEFPQDVREALDRADVNLFEAHQLARLTPKRLGMTEAEARALRGRLLEAHLRAQGSGTALRGRVREALGEMSEPSAVETERSAVGKADELLEADPLDSTHLFFEELRRIGRALREVAPEDLTDEDVEAVMPALDELTAALLRIEGRRKRRDQQAQKLKI